MSKRCVRPNMLTLPHITDSDLSFYHRRITNFIYQRRIKNPVEDQR